MTQAIYPTNPPATQAGVQGVEQPLVNPEVTQKAVLENPIEPSPGVVVPSEEVGIINPPTIPGDPIPNHADVAVAPVAVPPTTQAEVSPSTGYNVEVSSTESVNKPPQALQSEVQSGKTTSTSDINSAVDSALEEKGVETVSAARNLVELLLQRQGSVE